MPDETTDRYRRAAEAFIAHPLLKAGPARDETVEWWAAQPSFRRAVDANRAADETAGREARDAGPCMDSSPRFAGCTPLLCELRAGHIGGHECGTTRWTKANDVERARSERDAYEAGFEAGREAAAQAIEAKSKDLDFRLFAKHQFQSSRLWPDGTKPTAPNWNPGCSCGASHYYFEHPRHLAEVAAERVAEIARGGSDG